jgi:hypothetical protein
VDAVIGGVGARKGLVGQVLGERTVANLGEAEAVYCRGVLLVEALEGCRVGRGRVNGPAVGERGPGCLRDLDGSWLRRHRHYS